MGITSFQLLLLLVPLSSAAYLKRDDEGNCTDLLDVITVVDGSDSINDDDFDKLQEAMIKLAEKLDLSDRSQRMGAVVYSSGVADTAPLSSNLTALRSRILSFPHPKMGTSTHDGIETMRLMFQNNAREGVPQTAIVITDGRSIDPAATSAAAKKAKSQGIKIIAVGVGHQINTTELRTIASSWKNVKEIDNYSQLEALVTSLMKKHCIVDGKWTKWSDPTEGSCSVTCGQGVRTLSYTRTCTNPPPKNGGKNCTGGETKTETVGCSKSECPTAEWCNGCRYDHGAGYMPHRTDCRYFLQCVNNGFSHFVLPCPSGLYWSQRDLICTSSRANCTADIPHFEPGDVPEDKPYIPFCDGTKRHISGNANEYEEDVPNVGWVSRQCAPGTVFKTTNCHCEHGGPVLKSNCAPDLYIPFNTNITDESRHKSPILNHGVRVNVADQGVFNGDGLQINRYTNMDFRSTLVIDFLMIKGYRTSSDQVIVTNSDCDEDGSIYIILRRSGSVEFRVLNTNNIPHVISLAYTVARQGFTRVTLTVAGREMKAQVNGEHKEIPFHGLIGRRHCAVQIGRKGHLNKVHLDSYRGLLDDFKIYHCKL